MILRMLACAGLLSFAASAAAAQDKLAFSIIGVEVDATIPTGYCLPTGKEKAAADLLAAADTFNMTHAMLIRCDRMGSATGPGNDYFLIKTPRNTLMATLPRAELLAALEAEFGKAEWQSGGAALEKAMGDVSDSMSQTFNAPVDVKGEFSPRGTDTDCGYMGGEMTIFGSHSNYPIQSGACITTAGNKLVTVYAFDDPKGTDGIIRLMRKARDLAMSFAPKAADTP